MRIKRRVGVLAAIGALVGGLLSIPGSHELRLRYRPLRRVGICIPGGAAAYPSTLLMTVCPAQAAGVKALAVVMPPTPFGSYNRDMLATCHELGVTEVYRVGGAQAVAALAYGVEGLPAVDMIVGPGNLFVTLAKRYVYGQVAIDMLAASTELRDRLESNTKWFRGAMTAAGFLIQPGFHPIVPIRMSGPSER